MKWIISIFVTFGFIFILPLSARGDAIDVQKISRPPMGSIFDLLPNDSSVYLCSIGKIDESPHDSPVSVSGKVTLLVSDTILGKSCSKLFLPYSSQHFEGPNIWPDLNPGLKTNLLCIVVSGSIDTSCAFISGVTNAADYVVFVSGESDPLVNEMHVICKLKGLADRKGAENALVGALKSTNSMVRDYACQLTIMKLGAKKPTSALKIIESLVASDRGPEMLRLLYFMRTRMFMAMDERDRRQLNQLLCRCYLILAQSSSTIINNDALIGMSETISGFGHDAGFRHQDVLTASEERALSKIISNLPEGSSSMSIKNVQEWLNGKAD